MSPQVKMRLERTLGVSVLIFHCQHSIIALPLRSLSLTFSLPFSLPHFLSLFYFSPFLPIPLIRPPYPSLSPPPISPHHTTPHFILDSIPEEVALTLRVPYVTTVRLKRPIGEDNHTTLLLLWFCVLLFFTALYNLFLVYCAFFFCLNHSLPPSPSPLPLPLPTSLSLSSSGYLSIPLPSPRLLLSLPFLPLHSSPSFPSYPCLSLSLTYPRASRHGGPWKVGVRTVHQAWPGRC